MELYVEHTDEVKNKKINRRFRKYKGDLVKFISFEGYHTQKNKNGREMEARDKHN